MLQVKFFKTQSGKPRAKPGVMKITALTRAALAFQLLALPAGLCIAAPNQNPTAQTTTESSAKADRELTAKIRDSIFSDKSLSTSAHNVKIITRGGDITLRGKVATEAEKQSIEAKATALAGTGKVTNDLVVSSK